MRRTRNGNTILITSIFIAGNLFLYSPTFLLTFSEKRMISNTKYPLKNTKTEKDTIELPAPAICTCIKLTIDVT